MKKSYYLARVLSKNFAQKYLHSSWIVIKGFRYIFLPKRTFPGTNCFLKSDWLHENGKLIRFKEIVKLLNQCQGKNQKIYVWKGI